MDNPNIFGNLVPDYSGITNPINQQNIDSGGLTLNYQPPPTTTPVDGTSQTSPTDYSGGTTPTTDPYAQYGGQTAYNNNVGQYDQGIANTQAAINRLPGQQASAQSSIDASYQNALNQLLLGKNQSQSAYDTNKLQTGQNYVGAKNTVGANAGSALSGLLRLLGSRGAGGGSAYRLAAPGAVARQATLQRAGIGQTFGQNNQALDTGWNNYLTGYNNQVSSAGNQRDQSKSTLQQQINTNNENLLRSLAQLQSQKASYTGGNAVAASQSYIDQANALANTNANYTTAPINYQTQAYNAPSLASYTTAPNTAPTVNGQAATNDYYSPYLSALLGKKQTAGV